VNLTSISSSDDDIRDIFLLYFSCLFNVFEREADHIPVAFDDDKHQKDEDEQRY